MRPLVLPVLLAALATPAFALAVDEEIAEGLPAPAFQLRTLNSGASQAPSVSLDALVGPEAEDASARAVLLSFFASWCGPCKKELPYLQQLHAMYKDQGLRVISVNIDKDEAGIALAKRLAAASKVTFPVLSDRFNFLARRYLGEASPLPSVFIIRKDGTIARIEKGYGKDASSFLLAEVQKVLGIGKPIETASSKK